MVDRRGPGAARRRRARLGGVFQLPGPAAVSGERALDLHAALDRHFSSHHRRPQQRPSRRRHRGVPDRRSASAWLHPGFESGADFDRLHRRVGAEPSDGAANDRHDLLCGAPASEVLARRHVLVSVRERSDQHQQGQRRERRGSVSKCGGSVSARQPIFADLPAVCKAMPKERSPRSSR